MFLEREEKIGLILLLFVTVACGVGTILLEEVGKDSFAVDYSPDLPDGSLVRWVGEIQSVSDTKEGDHLILKVDGLTIFIPASSRPEKELQVGKPVLLYGTVQHWQGRPELVIQDSSDIIISDDLKGKISISD